MLLTAEELAEDLERALHEVENDKYNRGMVWVHKDGELYEIVNGDRWDDTTMKEYLNEHTMIERVVQLVWYRKYKSDILEGELFVRTLKHFEKSFTHVPKDDIIHHLIEK